MSNLMETQVFKVFPDTFWDFTESVVTTLFLWCIFTCKPPIVKRQETFYNPPKTHMGYSFQAVIVKVVSFLVPLSISVIGNRHRHD